MIQFIDLKAQRESIQPHLDKAFADVMAHGQYILGPEVSNLEQKLSDYTGAKHVISCASGTDALKLVLIAKELKVNDVVFVPSFTFASTAEVVAELGAIPYFIDIDPTSYNLCPESLSRGIEEAKAKGLVLKGIIAVDLFGLPAPYTQIETLAKAHNLWVLADAAQSFGGHINQTKVGKLCEMTATSFFPSKPLGGYGDGGCLFTEDDTLAEIVRSLRVHGAGRSRYDHVRIGMNSRLDTFQAAVLLEKLKIFDNECERRQVIAKHYNEALSDCVETPQVPSDSQHAYGLYTIRCPQNQRDKIKQQLQDDGIPSAVYYQKPLHLQPAYQNFPCEQQKLTNTDQLKDNVLSLPMHPYLTDSQVERIIQSVRSVF